MLELLRVGSSANMVQKKNSTVHKPKDNKNKSEGKGKSDKKNKPSQSTNFKKNNDKQEGILPYLW